MRYERSTGSPGISLVYNTLFRSFPLFPWSGNSIATCLHDETPSSINSFALCSFSRYCLIPTTHCPTLPFCSVVDSNRIVLRRKRRTGKHVILKDCRQIVDREVTLKRTFFLSIDPKRYIERRRNKLRNFCNR